MKKRLFLQHDRTIMNRRQLRELIILGESTTTEFKRKFTTAEKISREVVAFANTKGGYLLIGVDDDGSIVGVDSEKSVIDEVSRASSFWIDPPIETAVDIIEIDYKDVIVIGVEESQQKPHRVLTFDEKNNVIERKAYIRQGENSVIASKQMEQVLSSRNANSSPVTLSISDKEKRLFAYLDTHQKATVKDFAKLVNISERWAARLLVRLVRAGALHIHSTNNGSEFYTLV